MMLDDNGTPATITRDELAQFLCRSVQETVWDCAVVAQEEGLPFDVHREMGQALVSVCSWLNENRETMDERIAEFNKALASVDDPNELIDRHWESVEGAFVQMKKERVVSPEVSAAEVMANMMLQPAPKTIPPTRPILAVLGVTTEKEWNDLSPSRQRLLLLRAWSDKNKKSLLVRHGMSLISGWATDASRRSVSAAHTSSLEEAEDDGRLQQVADPKAAKAIEVECCSLDMDDNERLQNFAELGGIDLNEFTPKERNALKENLDLLDTAVDKSSKTGISFKDYYGAQADSKKTQRSRLFKKVRRLSQNPHLK